MENRTTIPTLNYWAIEYYTNHHHPKDMDFYMSEYCFFDIEVYGELWDNWCSPEVVFYDYCISTNDGSPLVSTIFKNPCWKALKPEEGIFPNCFVAKSFKITVYSNSIRSQIINEISCNICIDDPLLIDTVHWFPSLIAQVTNSQTISRNTTLNIFCKILQPRSSQLTITIQHGNVIPSVLFQAILDDFARFKEINIPYLFGGWGIYTIKYSLVTRNLDYVDNWCEATEDYIVEESTVITVGES